jgi:hypothetical protein
VRFGIVSLEGVSLWIASRIQDEGDDVMLYHMPPHDAPFKDALHKTTGQDIVPLAKTWEQFIAYQPDHVIFDCSDFGEKADALRRSGFSVFGSCKFYDRLEKERSYGIRIAQLIGMEVPEFYEFGTISQSLAWLASRPSDEEWFFKSDRELGAAYTQGGNRERLTATLKFVRNSKGDRLKHILQKKIDGAVLMTSTYWNGQTFLAPWMGTLEKKEFGNDDTGPKTGCSANVVWMYPDIPKIVLDEHWDRLAEIFRKEQAPAGNIDINTICSFDDGKPYFLEWTPRYGIDSEPTAQRLLTCGYGEFIARMNEATLPMAPFRMDEAAYSIRLSVPPYPYEPTNMTPTQPPVGLDLIGIKGSLWGERPRDRFVGYGLRAGENHYQCSDPFGLLGIASVTGTDLERMNESCVAYARGLQIPDLGYRTDGDVALAKDLAAVRRAGYEAPLL